MPRIRYSVFGIGEYWKCEFGENAKNISEILKYISDVGESMENISGLIIESPDNTNLEGIQNFEALRYLALVNSEIEDLSLLSNLVFLEELHLVFNMMVKDLSPLSNLGHLRYLDTEFCREISDLSPLSSIASLECVKVYDNLIKDFKPLLSCDKLKWLYVDPNNLEKPGVRELQEKGVMIVL